MNINKLDLAWAAGLFEGEGSFFNGRDHQGIKSFNVCIGSFTDLDVLEKFHKATNYLGKIHGPYYPKTSDGRPKKTTWSWSVKNFEGAQTAMAMFWPWLGSRRKEAAKRCLTAFLSRPKPAKISRKAQTAKRPEILKMKALGIKNAVIAKELDVSRAFVTKVM